jgi:endonuclease/exonuclease/phosphatase family metal-dependent hydrolase
VPTLSVLQFNAWLLAFPWFAYSSDYRERLALLPDALVAVDVDVISLQEVWRNRDKDYLERELRKRGYHHFVFTRHRFGLGDGMFLASRHPFKRIERERPFRTFTQLMEAIAAKRAIAATLEVPGVGDVDFYQTHLGSVLFDEKKLSHDRVSRKRLLVQLLEVARFIGRHRQAKFAILTGDLNFHYQVHEGARGFGDRYADEYTRFVETLRSVNLCFENSFLAANGMDVSHLAVPTYSQQNPYARQGVGGKNPEETLDYVLFTPDEGWRALESNIVFRERISERVPALSDHYGIRTVFEFSSPGKQ